MWFDIGVGVKIILNDDLVVRNGMLQQLLAAGVTHTDASRCLMAGGDIKIAALCRCFCQCQPFGIDVMRYNLCVLQSKGINCFAKHRAFNTDFGTRFKQQLRQQTQRILRAQCE